MSGMKSGWSAQGKYLSTKQRETSDTDVGKEYFHCNKRSRFGVAVCMYDNARKDWDFILCHGSSTVLSYTERRLSDELTCDYL